MFGDKQAQLPLANQAASKKRYGHPPTKGTKKQDEPLPTAHISKVFKILLVLFDCIFIGIQPILVHMSKNEKNGYDYSLVSVNLVIEIAKTIFAFGTILVVGTNSGGKEFYTSFRRFNRDAYQCRLLMVPAIMYAVNNYLKFSMQIYFTPTATRMISNLKVFTIALLMKLVLKRSFSILQWEALVLLVIGISISQLTTGLSIFSSFDYLFQLQFSATACVLGTVTVPAAGSVFNELALKSQMQTSVHLQNFFLYFYGTICNLFGLLLATAFGQFSLNNMFKGYTFITFLIIVNNAAQGILSSFFFKFADTILKKYSSTVATIVTGVLSAIIFGHELTATFCVGLIVVFISMHQFFSKTNQLQVQQVQTGPKGVVKNKVVPMKQNNPGYHYSPSLDHIYIKKGASQSSFSDVSSTSSEESIPISHSYPYSNSAYNISNKGSQSSLTNQEQPYPNITNQNTLTNSSQGAQQRSSLSDRGGAYNDQMNLARMQRIYNDAYNVNGKNY